MKKLLLLFLITISFSSVAQISKMGGMASRVNDSTAYVTNSVVIQAHTDGYHDIWLSNASNLWWVWNGSSYVNWDPTASGGGATAAGATGNVQYKSNGGGLQAEAALTYDSATNTLDADIITVNTEVYDATGWNGDNSVPDKDAVRDKIESLGTQYLEILATDQVTPIAAVAGQRTFIMANARTLTAVHAFLVTPQASGSIFTVDINEAGSTILSTKLTIDNTEDGSTTAATPAVISDASLAQYAEISIDVDQIGNGSAIGLILIFYWQ